MKVLANDGISKAGEKVLKDAGFEFLDHTVAQEQLENFINENKGFTASSLMPFWKFSEIVGF